MVKELIWIIGNPYSINRMTNTELRTCRVCGLVYDNYYPWGEDGNSPTEDACFCCGVESGYGDNNIIAIKNWREKWIAAGAKWRYPEKKPSNWSLGEQLKNIPERFK